MSYFRPIPRLDPARPEGAFVLAGGWTWFDTVEVLSRDGAPRLMAAADLPEDTLARLTAPRPSLAGLVFDRPSLMGIVNVTPDSFSDGGVHLDPQIAVKSGLQMLADGAAILDIGGESTRPGAGQVPAGEEIRRVVPVIAGLRAACPAPISVDTRKAAVARAARSAGATLVNDVSGLAFDPALAPFCAETGLPVCVMHAQGTPETMQLDPRYDDVTLDVYDFLAERVAALGALGIARSRIVVDPGIGFGKTLEHNLELLRNLALFHGLGCPILLGVSRKRFIGTIGGAELARARMPGSIAMTLHAVGQGVQLHRVHDVAETAQALRLWQAVAIGA